MPAEALPEDLETVFDHVVAIVDPADRLRTLRERLAEVDGLLARLRDQQAQTVRELRDAGCTWDTIGGIAGVTPQRATQLAR